MTEPFLKTQKKIQQANFLRSTLGWKIAAVTFTTVLIIQCFITGLSISKAYDAKINQLKDNALTVFETTFLVLSSDQKTDKVQKMLSIDSKIAQDILNRTQLRGFAIYTTEFKLIGRGGETFLELHNIQDTQQSYISRTKGHHEIIMETQNIGTTPFYVVTNIDTSSAQNIISESLISHIIQIVTISLIITFALMIVLGRLYLRPILFLKTSLQVAAINPEKPSILKSPFSKKDEMGSAILLAQNLIKANARNIREIKGRAQDQIHRLAYYDNLTKLPNRISFLERLEDFKKRNEESPYENKIQCAVIALDLDHFKDINDSMGHAVGDAILKAVGHRLRSALPETAIVARVGEDEFAIAIPLVGTTSTAKVIGEKIQSVIRSAPFSAFKENFQIRTSLGVATFPDDGGEPDKVLKNADIALNRAKEDGRDTLREYSEDFDRAVQARFQMLRDLRDALEQNQLIMNYQPQLDLNTGHVIGAEALIRWWKPDPSAPNGLRFISPADFIPVAEQSGLIVPIGEWVMWTACKKAKEWHNKGHNIRIAINVSGAQFHQSDIVNLTRKILNETGIEPHLVELEVTESIFMDDIHHTIGILQELHALGVELAIDDFGTGYSSLSYLRQFPIDRLKIDQSFIKNALNDQNDASIAKTIITLGHALNLKVIAEGVETKEHQQFLLDHNCDEVQGFRYSKPVIAEEFDKFMESYTNSLDYFEEK